MFDFMKMMGSYGNTRITVKVKKKAPVCILGKITMALLNEYALPQAFKCLTGDI